VTDSLFPDPDDRLVLEADCRRCPALAACRERTSWGVSPRDADVMVVGEAPGAGDPDAERWQGGNHTGMADTSAHSGRRVHETIRRAGVERAFYTNAVKCFPREGVLERGSEGDRERATERERASP
jgi:uracil-DNA glycosylase